MSSPSRVIAVLGLFTGERPVWSPDEINAALDYSRPTGYRYVKELVDTGLLRKVAAGRYALGARIIELDYQLRRGDPLLLAATPVMDALARRAGLDAVLTVLFAGPRIVDVHRAGGESGLELAYGRGRPRPPFRSAAPKVLLAGLPRAALARIHAAHAHEIAESGMGASWPAFRAYLAEVRRRGSYRSHGELQPELGAMAVPVHDGDGDCVAALALVGRLERIDRVSDTRLRGWLAAAADAIRERLGAGGAVPAGAGGMPGSTAGSAAPAGAAPAPTDRPDVPPGRTAKASSGARKATAPAARPARPATGSVAARRSAAKARPPAGTPTGRSAPRPTRRRGGD
jgi:DNA-binding IclR family transcriptional regulator